MGALGGKMLVFDIAVINNGTERVDASTVGRRR